MYLIPATIRDYNAAADTATIELVGAGVIDSWLDGIAIDPALNRSLVVHGAITSVSTPDPHRICEATITAIAGAVQPVQAFGGAAQLVQTGRVWILTNTVGQGSTTAVFSQAFSSSTNLSVSCSSDFGYPSQISGISATQFTVSVSAAPPNTYVYLSYEAEGNK